MNTWIKTSEQKPGKRGWYLVHLKAQNVRYKADGDTVTNNMAVKFFNGSKFPYDNRYHAIDYWMNLPAEPEEEQIRIAEQHDDDTSNTP